MTKKETSSAWFTLLPTLPKDRVYGMFDMLTIQICFGIAAWFFLVGGFTGLYLPAREAIITVIFGNQIPLFLISLLALYSARYGVDQWIASRAVLGPRFNDILLIAFYLGSSAGWIAYAGLLAGNSVQKINLEFGGPGIISDPYWGPVIFAIVAILIGWYNAYLGPTALKWVSRFGAIFMVTVLLYFIYYILVITGIEKIFTEPPKGDVVADFGVPENFSRNWALALTLEWNVGLGFSWAFWYGQWTRLVKNESAAYHGTLWGWGIIAAVSGVFSALTAIIIGSFDPTDWILTAPFSFAILALILFAIANITSIMMLIYPLSITTVSRFPKLKWSMVTIIFAILGILVSIIPGVFERYNVYLAIISLLTGIYGALLTGGYLLTRGEFSVEDMYDMSKNSKYYYVGGFNLAAVIATIVGFIFYLTTFNPLTTQSMNGLFPYISAGIPTYFVTLATFLLLSKVLKQTP
jgi:Cytosine/uracil/thiamine/allantoin permeases